MKILNEAVRLFYYIIFELPLWLPLSNLFTGLATVFIIIYIINLYMWKKNISAIITLIFVAFTHSIYIPLTGQLPRCTIIYSVGEAETVKLDLNFPPIPGGHAD